MVNPVKKRKKIVLIVGITAAVYGGFQFLLPLVIPFLCAYGTAIALRPSVRFLERRLWWKFRGKIRHFPIAVIGAVELTVLLFLLGLGLYVGGVYLIDQLEQLTLAIPQGLSWLNDALNRICRKIGYRIGIGEDHLIALVDQTILELGETLRQNTMPTLMNRSMEIVTGVTERLIEFVIFYLATILFFQEMDEIRERKSRSLFHREFALIGRRIVNVGSAWIRTEATIILVTTILCTIGFWIIGNDYALLVGSGIGLLDAFPFFGAGTVLIPWGLVYLVKKQWFKAGVLLGLFAGCYFLRQILEAKLMGDRMGLSPVETLVSMYVGLKLFGLVGFLLGPVGLLMIEDLVELYWKQETDA